MAGKGKNTKISPKKTIRSLPIERTRDIMGDTVFTVFKYSFFGSLIVLAALFIVPLVLGAGIFIASSEGLWGLITALFATEYVSITILAVAYSVLSLVATISGLVIIYRAFRLTAIYRVHD